MSLLLYGYLNSINLEYLEVKMNFIYSDMEVGLPIARCGNVRLVYDEECIKQSLYVLFATITHERVRSPFGSELVRLLFQPISKMTEDRIKREIIDKIKRWEPRIQIDRLTITGDVDNNSYGVDMEYTMLKIGRRGSFQTKLNSFN